MNDIKYIAFYLPQYHCFPENDEWWGKGFTEWTNVKKAKQYFKWQDQPRRPLNNNYYDLDKDFDQTIHWQISLAKEYGIYGFCFYHYWFKGGKVLMQKPVERYLSDNTCELPFCVSWANEPWTRAWDGKNKQVIMPQEYGGPKEWEEHFYYLLPYFRDTRYICKDGQPVIVIYRPEIIDELDNMLSLWKELAVKEGLGGLCVMSQSSIYATTTGYRKSNFIDYRILYEPGVTQAQFSVLRGNVFQKFIHNPVIFTTFQMQKAKRVLGKLIPFSKSYFNTTIWDYDLFWKVILNRKYEKDDWIPGAFIDWDNTPRRGAKNGRLFKGATPEKFAKYMTQLVKKVRTETQHGFIFIDAWNEWCEGTYLEPDEKNGYGCLEGIRQSLL